MADPNVAQTPSPTAPEPPANRHPLTAREQSIFDELSLLDPELAGLFERGISELQRPANPYVLAHIGRELNRGVIATLISLGTTKSVAPPDEVPDDELDLVDISAGLGMPMKHPLVRAWQRNYRDLTACVHYRKKKRPPPTREEVEVAFRTLSELLFGRIAPYFQTQRKLEELLAVAAPEATALERLKPVLLRPPQRVFFFRKLDQVGWLRPLFDAGFFSTPPDATADTSGRLTWMGWPEGDYLVRMAKQDPDVVFQALKSVPATLRNPVVWYNVVQAALELPAELSAQLVPQLLQALHGPVRVMFPEGLVELAIKLARSGKLNAAFTLAEKLTELDVREGEARSALARTIGHNDVEMRFFDHYEVEERIPPLIEALEEANARKCLMLLAKRLGFAIRAHRTDSAEESNDYSYAWCEDLEQPEDLPRDVRSFLLKAVAGVAKRLAARGSVDAEGVLAILKRYAFDAFRRVELHVLHAAGAAFPERIDAVLRDKELIDDRLGSREYGPLVAKFFEGASHDAQRSFVETLTAGPERSHVRDTLARWSRPVTDDEIDNFVRSWQGRRLVWFGDAVPAALQDLVALVRPVLERNAEEDAKIERRLLRTGPVSPFTIDGLRAMSPGEIAKILRAWTPEPHGEATHEGLARTLVDVIAADPANFGVVLTEVQREPRTEYVSAVLDGLVHAIDNPKAVDTPVALPWPELMGLIGVVVRAELPADKREQDRWRWAKRQVVRLIMQSAAKNLIPGELADAVWNAVEIIHRSDETWVLHESVIEKEFDTFYGVLSHALNARSGEAVELALVVALWNYRKAKAGNTIATSATRVLPLLDRALSVEGKAADAARVVIGKYLPQILLLDPEFLTRHSTKLFVGQLGGPDWDRVWGGYLTGARLYDDTFPVLKPIYVRSAHSLAPPDTSERSRDRDFAPGRRLIDHVVWAVIRGLARRDDDDRLVQVVLDCADLSDLAHAYWSLFRGFSDSKSPDPGMVDRLVDLWQWRVSELEKTPSPRSAAEASGLGWLFMIEAIPDDVALDLLNRSSRLATDGFEMAHSLWGRLARIASKKPAVATEIASVLIESELRGEYPHFNRQEVAAVLERGLQAGGAIKKNADRLVNRLGDAGFNEFGDLLPGAQAVTT